MRLPNTARNHWRHHNRFYLSAALGGFAWAAGWTLDPHLRLVLAGDVFYAAYLIWALVLVNRLAPATMRKRSSVEDEGTLLIMLLTLAAIVFSLVSLFGIFGPDKHCIRRCLSPRSPACRSAGSPCM